MRDITVHVPEEDRSYFSTRPVLCRHNLHESPYFGDTELINLLDEIPRSHLRVWSLDYDPKNSTNYTYIDTTGVRGQDILESVRRGQLWVNLQRVDKFFDHLADCSRQLYESLSAQCPHFKVDFVHSYILLSSPNMYFQLHIDSYENMFWCTKGGKTFYLYPPEDERIVTQDLMEDICDNAVEDFLPHREETEYLRKEYQIAPGNMLSWPQHSPHEFVNNADLNAGLGTFHGSRASTNRNLNYQASRYFRENWRVLRGEVRHNALGTLIRRNLYRGVRRLGLVPAMKNIDFWTNYRLDPDQPNCIAKIENGPKLVEFSRQRNSE